MRLTAKDLVEQYNTADPFVLADYEEIDYSFEALPQDIKGFTITHFDKPYIVLNDDLYDSQQRYVIMAHELYHALYHYDISYIYASFYNGKGKFEHEADIFATQLMTYLFEEKYDTKNYTFNHLVNTFSVKEATRDYFT